MGTVTHPERWQQAIAEHSRPGSRHRSGLPTSTWIMLAAVAAPIAVAVALIPWRQQLDTADSALILVVVIVAVAGTGRRLAAAVAAMVSALSFDFFLTRPYQSLRISRHTDLITELLLVVVGLAVGELAARGRRHRDAAWEGRHQMAMLHSLTELAASGRDPEEVVAVAAHQLRALLSLRASRFTAHDVAPATARVTPRGEVLVGEETWSTGDLGLPTRTVDLPVRSGGWLFGHFLLTPTPGKPVPPDRLLVAVAMADQVGAALAHEEMPDGSPASARLGPSDRPDVPTP
jgi:K+-sensing histidine kinase KdpD